MSPREVFDDWPFYEYLNAREFMVAELYQQGAFDEPEE